MTKPNAPSTETVSKETSKEPPLTPEQLKEKHARAEAWQRWEHASGVYDHQTPQSSWLPQNSEPPDPKKIGALESENIIRNPKKPGIYLVYYVDPTPSLAKNFKRILPFRGVQNPGDVAEDQAEDLQNKTLQGETRLQRAAERILTAPGKMKRWLLEEKCKCMYLSVDANGNYGFARTPESREERLEGYRLMVHEYARGGEKILKFDFPQGTDLESIKMDEVMAVLRMAERAGVIINPGEMLQAKLMELGPDSRKKREYDQMSAKLVRSYHERKAQKDEYESRVHDRNVKELGTSVTNLKNSAAEPKAAIKTAVTDVSRELSNIERSVEAGKPSAEICQRYDQVLEGTQKTLESLNSNAVPANKAEYNALLEQTKKVKDRMALEASPADNRADEKSKTLTLAATQLDEAIAAMKAKNDAASVKTVGDKLEAVTKAMKDLGGEVSKPEAAKDKLDAVARDLEAAKKSVDSAKAGLDAVTDTGLVDAKNSALEKHKGAEAVYGTAVGQLNEKKRVAEAREKPVDPNTDPNVSAGARPSGLR